MDDDTRPDLVDRVAVHDLVVEFYREVVFDDLLGPVFGEIAEVDWAIHIPHLIDYWCRVLLGEPGYSGAILDAHARIHEMEPLRPEHFDRWLVIWQNAISRRWSGPQADRALNHATRIAEVLERRLPCPAPRRTDLAPPGAPSLRIRRPQPAPPSAPQPIPR